VKKNIVPMVVLVIFIYSFMKLYNDVFKVEFNIFKFIAMVLILVGTVLYMYSILKKLNTKK
jgi:hypothetical protein